MGDIAALEQLCIAPIRSEVFRLTWTHERYNCRGTPVHSPYYYEYPAVLGTIVRDVQYGVSFGLSSLKGVGSFKLDPFVLGSFSWSIGQLAIEYAPPSRACFSLGSVQWPAGTECTVTGLATNGVYKAVVTNTASNATHTTVATASSKGVVQLRLQLKAFDKTCLTLERED